MSAALPSIIAMKHSYKHRDDLNIKHEPTLRTKIEQALWAAEGMAKQSQWDEAKAREGERLKLVRQLQLFFLDLIESKDTPEV